MLEQLPAWKGREAIPYKAARTIVVIRGCFVSLNEEALDCVFFVFCFCFFMLQSMLRQYGPSVPEELLLQLVNAFGELRSRADQGLISYPYSTREVVSVVKHLQV